MSEKMGRKRKGRSKKMKFLKKVVSALLAAVTSVTMLFAGSVTAGAATKKTEKSPYYVTYKESSDELILTIYGFSEEDYAILTRRSEGYTAVIELYFNEVYYYIVNDSPLLELRVENYTFEGNYVSYRTYRGDGVSHSGMAPEGLIKSGDFIRLGTSADYPYAFQFVLDILNPYWISPSVWESIKSLSSCSVSAYGTFGAEAGWYDVINSEELPFGKDSSSPSATSVSSSSSSSKDISSLNIGEISNKAYTGESLKPSVTIKDGSKTLKKGTDYMLTYKNNKAIGTATVTVTGKGDYSGTKTLTFQIVPKKTTLTAKRSGEKITFQWDAVKGAEKYEIFYREKGEDQYKKLATVSGKKTNYSTTELDKNKTYQFQIRSYKKSNGEKVYSKFSKTVTVG